jgi:hypothetical protein
MLPLLAVAAVLGLWWFTRTREIFVLSVRDGRPLVVRGRIPPGLLADIGAVVARPAVRRATIKALAGEHNARLVCSGDLDEGRVQRLRNVFGVRPVARLRATPAIARPSLGQLLGVAWIAWLFEPRD